MTSFKPWICMLAAAGSQALWAENGVIDYRNGHYFAAQKAFVQEQNKDPVMDYYVARMRLYGYGLLKNNHMALKAFTQAGEKGYLPAQQLLARYYLLKANDPEKALYWFKKAAVSDVDAQLYVVGAYLTGYGTRENPDAARKYFIEAAKAGNALAQYTLADHFLDTRYRGNAKLGIIWLTKSAEQNNPKALVRLAQYYINGQYVTKDVFHGAELLEKAAKLNDMPAIIALAQHNAKQGRFSSALGLLEKPSEAQHADPQYALAQLFLQKDTPIYDAQKGFKWMLAAAENHQVDAELALAKLYKEGIGVEANEGLAKQWQAKADALAKSKNTPSPKEACALWLSNGQSKQFAASGYRLKGIYTDWHNPEALKQYTYNQNPQLDTVSKEAIYQPQFDYADPKAIPISDYFDVLATTLDGNRSDDWSYKHYPIHPQIQAVKDSESPVLQHPTLEEWTVASGLQPYPYSDDPIDLSNFFDSYTQGWEQAVNYQSILGDLYNKAILGETDSQFQIGQLYQYGIGVEKNPEQAKIYYELAAGQGDERSEYNLAILYLSGLLQPADYKKGIEWLTDAAFKGNPYAQYTLANIKEKGLSDEQGRVVVAPDHEQALAMYYLASSNHFGAAQDRLADFLVRANNKGLSVMAKKNRAALIKKLYRGAAENGVADAELPLAFYDAMENDPQKQAKAYEVAAQQAQAGNAGAALLLAMMLERGISVPANSEEAIAWYQKAALNPVSEFVLGTYYAKGEGTEKDLDKAKALLEQSALSGFAFGNYNLAILKQKMGEPFLKELDEARMQNNSQAGLLMADYFLQQANNEADLQKAKDIYRHFADKGDKVAQMKLGYMEDKGIGGAVNLKAAETYLLASAEQGYPLAQFLLGRFYQQGRLGAPDYAAAQKWFEASKQAFAPSAVAQGFIADTVFDDYAKAVDNYQIAASKGDVNAALNLGLIYDYGKGFAVNMEKAEQHYLAAAEKGVTPAMTQLAGLYFKGINGQRDEEKALAWYQKAAERGDRNANYKLGLFSETGIALPLDLSKAMQYYEKASQAGNDKATLALARMYQYGLGVAKDVQKAAELYKRLAEQNNPYAQYKLGKLYYEGALGENKADEGKHFLTQASQNGNQDAKKMLQHMDAQRASKTSMIEPARMVSVDISNQPAGEVYMDALNEWNQGEERESLARLNRLIQVHPDYAPARQAFEQIQGNANRSTL